MKKLIALVLLLLAAAACVQIPEEELKPPAHQEAQPQQNITEVVAPPVALPPANVTLPMQNVSNALAPLPKTNASTITRPSTTTAKNNSLPKTSGWTTEPLQIQEGETMRIVLQKPK